MTNKMKYFMVVCLMMIASTCMAKMQQQQPNCGEKPADGMGMHINKEQFARIQATRISQSLGLDDKTSQKFIETFCQCSKEMAASRPRHQKKKRAEMTDAEVDKAIKADFAQSRKLLDIREKYYKAYSKFLSPKQIQRVYDMERGDMQRFAKRWQGKGIFPKGNLPRKEEPRKCNPCKPKPFPADQK